MKKILPSETAAPANLTGLAKQEKLFQLVQNLMKIKLKYICKSKLKWLY